MRSRITLLAMSARTYYRVCRASSRSARGNRRLTSRAASVSAAWDTRGDALQRRRRVYQ